jgi:hypothetical protein
MFVGSEKKATTCRLPFHKAANKPEKEKEIRALLILVLPIRPQHKIITDPVAPFVLPFRQQKALFKFFVSSSWIDFFYRKRVTRAQHSQ